MTRDEALKYRDGIQRRAVEAIERDPARRPFVYVSPDTFAWVQDVIRAIETTQLYCDPPQQQRSADAMYLVKSRAELRIDHRMPNGTYWNQQEVNDEERRNGTSADAGDPAPSHPPHGDARADQGRER